MEPDDHRSRSAWLCTILLVVAVASAATAVVYSGRTYRSFISAATAWPELAVAALMAGLSLWSSAQILTQALGEYRQASKPSERAQFEKDMATTED